MSTALKRADLPSLFNKDYVSFSGGWCWEDRPYWGLVAEVSGIVPPSIKIDVPHDQYSTEYWFYFAAISRYICYAATMNGEVEQLPGFAKVCNKLAEELMKDSIANGTPVSMLLVEYELNEAHRQPDLSDFYVFVYNNATETGKATFELQQAHTWIMRYAQQELAEHVMCERCGECENDIKVFFSNKEMGKSEQRLCWSCFEEMTAIESAWSFIDWYKHTQQEQWSVNRKLTEILKEGYESYCKEQGVVPYWDTAETTEEALELGDFVEVMIPFTWSGEEQGIGKRFVVKKQHVNQGFERWVEKVS